MPSHNDDLDTHAGPLPEFTHRIWPELQLVAIVERLIGKRMS